MLSKTLRSKIDSLWDKFWSGGIANPLTAMEQISYLLFMRRLDEVDHKRQEDAAWLGQKYLSIFEEHEEYRWSHFRHLSGEEMLPHVRDKVFPFLKTIKNGGQVFTLSMQDAIFIIPNRRFPS